MLQKELISKVPWELMNGSLKSAGNSKGSEVKQVGQSLAWLNRRLVLELRGKGKVC